MKNFHRLKIAVALLIFWPFFITSAAICKPPRDAHGKILRSQAQVVKFKRTHVCPSSGLKTAASCKGYVVNHIKPLCACGADVPSNMEYQSIAAAKISDIKEKALCKKLTAKTSGPKAAK
jgi:hypothetical protein